MTSELQFVGRNVFMGYMHDPVSTAAAFTSDGYLRTGDLASIDGDNDPAVPPPSGFVKIIGRLKELIITSGGENMAPIHIENTVKKYNQAISNCMLIGDQRKYLTILLTIHCEVDPVTLQSTEKLNPLTLDIGKQIGSKATTITELKNDPLWKHYIEKCLNDANQHSISHAQRIQKYRIIDQDFTEHGGELTATMKLKRKFVLDKYADLINEMYQED